MNFSSKLLENAVAEFAKLPGIGKKTALRLVLHLLKLDAGNVQGFGETRRCRNLRLHDFENEEIIFIHEARIMKPAFEMREAFLNNRRRNFAGGRGRQFKFFEFVFLVPRTIADAHDLDQRARLQAFAHDLARKCRIVDDQDADGAHRGNFR